MAEFLVQLDANSSGRSLEGGANVVVVVAEVLDGPVIEKSISGGPCHGLNLPRPQKILNAVNRHRTLRRNFADREKLVTHWTGP